MGFGAVFYMSNIQVKPLHIAYSLYISSPHSNILGIPDLILKQKLCYSVCVCACVCIYVVSACSSHVLACVVYIACVCMMHVACMHVFGVWCKYVMCMGTYTHVCMCVWYGV